MQATPPTTATEAAAALLLRARLSGEPLPALPEALLPADADAAYAIQQAVGRQLGAVGGWKVGAKGPTLQPTCAPVLANSIGTSPGTIASHACRLRGVEAEIAVRLLRDLPPRDRPYAEDDLAAAIGPAMPALEVVDSRFASMARQPALALLADGLSNAGLVLGAAGGVLPADAARQQAEIFFDRQRVAGGAGGNPAGNLLRLLAWLANHAARWAGGLREGQVVTTGSWTGLLFAARGTHVRALLGGLGAVELSFA